MVEDNERAARGPGTDDRKDARRTRGYLDGDAAIFGEIDGWIRSGLWSCYPALRHEFDDLVQVVHEKLVVKLQEGRFEGRSTLRTYVGRIMHHTAIERLRRLYQERDVARPLSHDPESDRGNPYRALESLDERELLYRALQTMPASCRELWALVYVERLSYEEVGRRLSIPPGTVKSRMWHCRRKAMAALRRLRRLLR